MDPLQSLQLRMVHDSSIARVVDPLQSLQLRMVHDSSIARVVDTLQSLAEDGTGLLAADSLNL